MRNWILIFFILVSGLFTYGQNDSLQEKKNRKICIGTPLFPSYQFGTTKYFKLLVDRSNSNISFYPFFIPINIDYRVKGPSNKFIRRIGFTINKTNLVKIDSTLAGVVINSTTPGNMYLSTNIGIIKKITKSPRIDVSVFGDLVFSLLETYYQEGTVRNSYLLARRFLYGADMGIYAAFYLTKKIFIGSEFAIMSYIYSGKVVKQFDAGHNYAYWVSNISGSGVAPSKFFGLYIGYNLK